MKYFILLFTAIVTIMQVNNLKLKPFNLKAWSIVVLLCLITIATFILESDSDKADLYAKSDGVITSPQKKNLKLSLKLIGGPMVDGHIQYNTTEYISDSNGILNLSFLLPEWFGKNGFSVKVENDQILVSLSVWDSKGNIVAIIRDNEWQVNKNMIFDKNFDANTFEIKDNSGDIILQLDLKGELFNILGLFYGNDSTATVISKVPYTDLTNICVIEKQVAKGFLLLTPIVPEFKYPSNKYPGIRTTQKEKDNFLSKAVPWKP